jgi:hypothetical protein
MRLLVTVAGRVYKSDANNSIVDEFHGFVTSNTGYGSDATVVVSGVLGGFTGLTPGVSYYVQDTVGTLGTSAGSTSIEVGRAISATELLIKNY